MSSVIEEYAQQYYEERVQDVIEEYHNKRLKEEMERALYLLQEDIPLEIVSRACPALSTETLMKLQKQSSI